MAKILTEGSKSPLYQQVAQTVKQRIRQGEYQPDSPLPSVRTLRQEFGVSLTVIQRAMRNLEEDGIVTAHHGKEIKPVSANSCDQTAILFGFIHPYAGTLDFHRDVLDYADRTFADRHNLVVIRASNDDSERERSIAEHFIANGVKGLIVWPASNNSNGQYFEELSKTYPVVLVDRTISGTDLPSVISDTSQFGREIVTRILGAMKKQRLLVLIDNLKISAYERLIYGVQEQAAVDGRLADVTTVQLPISQAFAELATGKSDTFDSCSLQVKRLLEDGKYDSLFCIQDEFIEFGMLDAGVIDDPSEIQFATTHTKGGARTKKFRECNLITWHVDLASEVSQAADLLQRWSLSRRKPESVSLTVQYRLGEESL